MSNFQRFLGIQRATDHPTKRKGQRRPTCDPHIGIIVILKSCLLTHIFKKREVKNKVKIDEKIQI